MRILLAAGLLCCTLHVHAQSADPPFRERVVQLALIYGESSGIDLEGSKVVAREARKVDADCSDVEVTVSKPGKPVQRETVRACRTRRNH